MDSKIIIPLELPFTCVISGQTGSGKTEFIKKILENQNVMFDGNLEKILYCYSIYQDVYSEMSKTIPNIEFHEGLPCTIDKTGSHNLLVLDDLMIEASNDKQIASAFSKMRHNKLSSIFVTQNFYFGGKYMRTITLNSQYLILFRNFRDNSIYSTLGRQMFPNKKGFLLSAFNQATSRPFGYLFIDLKSNTDDKLRLRQNVLPHGNYLNVFI